MTEESAKSYDAIVNVSCSPCAYFHPAFPGQYMHWYPVNEMGEWSYGYFYWLVKVLDFHYEKGHKVYLHCHVGAYRSPHAAIFWLMSRGHTHEEAVEIEYNNPERVKEYKEERGGQHWKYKLTYCYRMGNIPKNVAELFKRMRENPTWSLAGVLLHGKKWIERSPEVMGNKRSRFRYWMHTTFWFYYKPKWWLKRRIDYGMYYVRGFQIEQPADSFGWSITNRPGEFASICRKIHKWRLKSWLKAFVSRS